MSHIHSDDCQAYCYLIFEQSKEVVKTVNSTFDTIGAKYHLAEDDNSYAEASIVLFAILFGSLDSATKKSFKKRQKLRRSIADSLGAIIGSDEDARAYLSAIEAVAKVGFVDSLATGKNPFHQMALILLGKCLHGSYDYFLKSTDDLNLTFPAEMIGDMLAMSASKNFLFWKDKGVSLGTDNNG